MATAWDANIEPIKARQGWLCLISGDEPSGARKKGNVRRDGVQHGTSGINVKRGVFHKSRNEADGRTEQQCGNLK
jgi:hypothetical protein